MTRYTITTSDAETHRLHLAGPGLVAALRDLDFALRDCNKHDVWPPEVRDESGAVSAGLLVEYVRDRLHAIAGESGGEL